MSYSAGPGLPRKGATLLSGAGRTLGTPYGAEVGLEGTEAMFDDVDPAPNGAVVIPRSGRKKKCILVRNVSGLTLERRRLVRWQAGFVNKRVDGYVNTDFAQAAGVVDEALSTAGVPNHDLFWLEVQGPCLVRTALEGNANNSFAEGQPLVALTAATSGATTAGRFQPFAATTGTTQAMSGAINMIGRAMTARTTGNTNMDTLVHLLMY